MPASLPRSRRSAAVRGLRDRRSSTLRAGAVARGPCPCWATGILKPRAGHAVSRPSRRPSFASARLSGNAIRHDVCTRLVEFVRGGRISPGHGDLARLGRRPAPPHEQGDDEAAELAAPQPRFRGSGALPKRAAECTSPSAPPSATPPAGRLTSGSRPGTAMAHDRALQPTFPTLISAPPYARTPTHT